MKHALPGYLAEFIRGKLAMAGVTPMADTFLTDLRYRGEGGLATGA